MRFVIVTGMSGGGKSTTMKMLEDMGFYCVDNLPIPLVDTFFKLICRPGSEITKVALGLDARADENMEEILDVLHGLKNEGYSYEIIFMEASDMTLVRTYK